MKISDLGVSILPFQLILFVILIIRLADTVTKILRKDALRHPREVDRRHRCIACVALSSVEMTGSIPERWREADMRFLISGHAKYAVAVPVIETRPMV